MRKNLLVLCLPALAVAVAVTACGSSPQGTESSASTSGPATTKVATTTTTVPPSTTTTATTSTPPTQAGHQLAGGPVPANFDPVSFTAVSAREYWLLGEAPCSNPVCTSIVRTTDGGTNFVGIPAPGAALDVNTGSASPTGGINQLRFADPQDGYAYDSNPGGALWVTHDGGAHWARPSFLTGHDLLAFGTGAGYAFALVGSCQNGSCANVVLERSPVSSEAWSALSVPVPAGVDQLATMTVHGTALWFSLTTAANQPNQLLVAGSGSGARFATYKSPCDSGLGGTVQASSSEVLWAVCPTGMMAQAFRSTDGGQQWDSLPVTDLENSALMAPASATSAVLEPSSLGQLLLTNNGGATWQPVASSNSASLSWSWMGFTDAGTGSALRVESNAPTGWPWPNGPAPEQLWRTSDGGATWSGPVTIG